MNLLHPKTLVNCERVLDEHVCTYEYIVMLLCKHAVEQKQGPQGGHERLELEVLSFLQRTGNTGLVFLIHKVLNV